MKNNELTEVNDKSSAIIEPVMSKFTELSIEHLIAQRDALVAENAALNDAIERVSGVYKLSPHIQKLCEVETPATDAAIAEINAQGIDKWIESRDGRWNGTTKEAEELAANLRAGRKG